MKRNILKRPQVLRDIEEAFVFIGEKDEDTGFDFLFAVEQTFEALAENSFLGTERNLGEGELRQTRMWRVKTYEKYLIFYLVREDEIEILRVIHSARDYNQFFEE